MVFHRRNGYAHFTGKGETLWSRGEIEFIVQRMPKDKTKHDIVVMCWVPIFGSISQPDRFDAMCETWQSNLSVTQEVFGISCENQNDRGAIIELPVTIDAATLLGIIMTLSNSIALKIRIFEHVPGKAHSRLKKLFPAQKSVDISTVISA